MHKKECIEIIYKIKQFCLWYLKKTKSSRPPKDLVGDFGLYSATLELLSNGLEPEILGDQSKYDIKIKNTKIEVKTSRLSKKRDFFENTQINRGKDFDFLIFVTVDENFSIYKYFILTKEEVLCNLEESSLYGNKEKKFLQIFYYPNPKTEIQRDKNLLLNPFMGKWEKIDQKLRQ